MSAATELLLDPSRIDDRVEQRPPVCPSVPPPPRRHLRVVSSEGTPVGTPIGTPPGRPRDLAPSAAGARRAQHPLASVTSLRAPRAAATAAPIRLTHRGIVAVSVLVAALGLALLWSAAASAPAAAGKDRAATGSDRGPATVTVRPGDTLWSIATRAAPQRDPRAEIAALQQRNHLAGVDVVPGQRLRTR